MKIAAKAEILEGAEGWGALRDRSWKEKKLRLGKYVHGKERKEAKNGENRETRARGEKLYVTAKFPDDASVGLTLPFFFAHTPMMRDLIQLRIVFFLQA